MKKLLFSYWGFCEEYNDSDVVFTPDGGRFTRPIFVKELLSRQFQVIALQQRREKTPLKCLQFDSGFPIGDVLFIEWRWPTYKNDKNHKDYIAEKYEPDLDRQIALLNYYHNKIPMVVWDTDLKVTNKDRKRWPNIIWTEPCFNPSENTIAMPYFTDYSIELFDTCKLNRAITYIGSNYERYWAVEKYFYNIGLQCKLHNINIDFFGNWLEKSPERPEQEEFVKRCSNFINFNKRNKFLEGMKILNESLCTIHIVKELYCKKQLVTPRFFESLACNTIAFIPEEFKLQLYGDEFAATNNIFENILEIEKLSLSARKSMIVDQKRYAKNNYPQTEVTCFVDNLLKLIK